MGHVLSELSVMTHPSWVALQSMAHSFIHKPLHHDKAVVHEGDIYTVAKLGLFQEYKVSLTSGNIKLPNSLTSENIKLFW